MPVELRRKDVTSARATTGQEYFWRLVQRDPDPATYGAPVVLLIDGPLDVAALRESVAATIASHSIYRTVFRDVEQELFQFVKPASDVPPFELEVVDTGTVPEAERRARWLAVLETVVARGFDYEEPRYVAGSLVVLAPEQHALLLVVHHIVADAAACAALLKDVFVRYRAAIGVPDAVVPGPGLQYIDYADALARWAESDEGQTAREFWRDQVSDARPMYLPTDVARDDVIAQESQAPGGILPIQMHTPIFTPSLDSATREAVATLARAERTPPFTVYLAAMAALVHELTHERVVWIETVYNPRAEDRRLEDLHGLVATWHVIRIEMPSTSPTLSEVVRVTKESLARIKGRGMVPDYYKLVPKGVRTVVVNYLFFIPGGPTMELAPKLTGARASTGFPPWKRPWDLHVTIRETPRETVFNWTGAEPLFKRETVGKLLERYIALLAATR